MVAANWRGIGRPAAMVRVAVLTIALLAGCSFWAQAQMTFGNPEGPPVEPAAQAALARARLAFRPNTQVLGQIVRTLQSQPDASTQGKAAAAALVQQADAARLAGRNAHARALLLHAAALAEGRRWDALAEYAASLVLRPDVPVADALQPLLLRLGQIEPAAYKPITGLTVRLSLAPARPQGVDAAPAPDQPARDIGVAELPARDLNDEPFRIAARLGDVADGAYVVIADVSDGATPVAQLKADIQLLRAPGAQAANVWQRLAQIKGHDDTKASVRYPFELIQLTVAERSETADYDFAAGLRRSMDLLAALEAGKDPLFKATGDQRRHYEFVQADEIMPYRLYVPTTWDGRQQLPLIVALHGGGQDENNMLSRANGVMQTLAEQRHMIVVAPLGYRPSGNYGEPFALPVQLRGTAFGFVPPAATPVRTMQLSERDVLNVMDRVVAEYGVDTRRIYLMGNSAGGGGTWLLGARFAARFAAVAPCASSMDIRGVPFQNFKDLPVLACVGERDADARKQVARFGVDSINASGGNATYLEVPNGTHGSGVEIAMPQLFDFFAAHRRRP